MVNEGGREGGRISHSSDRLNEALRRHRMRNRNKRRRKERGRARDVFSDNNTFLFSASLSSGASVTSESEAGRSAFLTRRATLKGVRKVCWTDAQFNLPSLLRQQRAARLLHLRTMPILHWGPPKFFTVRPRKKQPGRENRLLLSGYASQQNLAKKVIIHELLREMLKSIGAEYLRRGGAILIAPRERAWAAMA